MKTLSLEVCDPEAAPVGPVRRIVMIGFMGAGKSTVGSKLAKAMGWDFIDLDDEVASREGMPVHEIIRDRGITGFRRVESAVGSEVLRCRRTVISVGGGWPAEPGHMDMLAGGTVSVWLRVGAEAALERTTGSDTVRPLLQVSSDPRGVVESLLRERIPHYRRGDVVIDTEDRSPDEVVHEIMERFSRWKNGPTAARVNRNKEENE